MPETPKILSQPKLLIGEGQDELRFFKTFLKEMQIGDIQVEDYGGKGRLDSYIRTLKLRPGFTNLVSLGITRDADTSAQDAFDSVCGTLGAHGLVKPGTAGVIARGTPAVGIFILPDCTASGMLEDLCLASVANDPGMKCVEQYFECIKNEANRESKNKAKAKIQTWLASQIEPGKRLASAAEAGYWNWSSSVFDFLKEFMQAL